MRPLFASDKIPGGMSHVFKVAVSYLFSHNDFDIRRGIAYDVGERGTEVVRADVGLLVEDLLAHKDATLWKGDSSTKSCFKCINSVDIKSKLLPDQTGYLISGAGLDYSKRKLWTSAKLRNVFKRLAAVKEAGQQTSLGVLQQLFGFTYNEHNWLVDEFMNIDIVGYTCTTGCIYLWSVAFLALR